ncbi:MAG: NifB/NifX family molybdenum-iron cluster-binding protein [Clostridiales bacterium]
MKIAVTYENGDVFQHFGHTEQFKVYEIEDGKIAMAKIIGNNGSGHGALAGLLQEQGIDTLICGGIGGGAKTALANRGIKLYGGVTGNADKAVAALLEDKLIFNSQATCNHHGENHHSGTCGEHGCGEHNHHHE